MQTVVEPKRGTDVGRVVVDVLVENLDDIRRAERGELSRDAVRSVTVRAMVDTGATFFCLPTDIVQQLGLAFSRNRPANTVRGPMTLRIFGDARLEIQGRDCHVEVMELPQSGQALLGQVPLEMLDFWVDTTNQRLVGNPEHGGQWMAEVFRT